MSTPHRPRPGRQAGGELAQAAARAAAFGWWVFPLRPGGKTPAAPAAHPAGTREALCCKGTCGRWGHGLHDATTEPALVRAMWQRWPDANIGLSCGPSGLVVIDLDTTHGPRPGRVLRDQRDDEPTPDDVTDSAASFAWLRERRGATSVDLGGPVVGTPSGGWHLYFRAPDPDTGIRVTSGAGMTSGLGWGIDVRAHGGYVVAPPSVRPDGPYVGTGGPLRALPGWLLDALDNAGRVTRPRQDGAPCERPELRVVHGSGEQPATSNERRLRYLTVAVEGELQRVWDAPLGALNDTVTRAAFALGQLVTGAGLDRALVADALIEAARAAGSRHHGAGGKPFDEPKTAATIARALTAGAARPRTVRR